MAQNLEIKNDDEPIADDLASLLTECGFEVMSSEPHLVAKVVVARKPLD